MKEMIKKYCDALAKEKNSRLRNKELFMSVVAPVFFTRKKWHNLFYHYSPYVPGYRVNFRKKIAQKYESGWEFSYWADIGDDYSDFFRDFKERWKEAKKTVRHQDSEYSLMKKISRCLEADA